VIHTTIKPNSKVADDISYSNFCITSLRTKLLASRSWWSQGLVHHRPKL